MVVINNQEELYKYYIKENNTYIIIDDVEFKFNVDVKSNISTFHIIGKSIKALQITATNINAQNISAGEINATDINASYITAININAGNITAYNIKASNIKAFKVNADNMIVDYDINRGKIIIKLKNPEKRKAAGHGAKVLKK